MIDRYNKVRLIRAIEIAKELGRVPNFNDFKRFDLSQSKRPKEVEPLNFLQIGIELPKEKLYKNIKSRLEKRFKKGMIREVKNLHYKYGVSWKRLESFGLEYRWIAYYLQNKIGKGEMKEKLYQTIKDYAKRQMTWFSKDKRIRWRKTYKEIEAMVSNFLKN